VVVTAAEAGNLQCKRTLKQLLCMTPEMEQFLDQQEGEIAFVHHHEGTSDLRFKLADVLSCDAFIISSGPVFGYNCDGDDDGDDGDNKEQEVARCNIYVRDEPESRALDKSHIHVLAHRLFLGASTNNVLVSLLLEVASELAQIDSSEACHPAASMTDRDAVDAWIDTQQADQVKRTKYGGIYVSAAYKAPVYFGYYGQDYTACLEFLRTYKHTFNAGLRRRVTQAMATIDAITQVLEHVECIVDNLHLMNDYKGQRPTPYNIRQLRQNHANSWAALVKLTSIPLAMMLVLLNFYRN
jgi:hypothetical protein